MNGVGDQEHGKLGSCCRIRRRRVWWLAAGAQRRKTGGIGVEVASFHNRTAAKAQRDAKQ